MLGLPEVYGYSTLGSTTIPWYRPATPGGRNKRLTLSPRQFVGQPRPFGHHEDYGTVGTHSALPAFADFWPGAFGRQTELHCRSRALVQLRPDPSTMGLNNRPA